MHNFNVSTKAFHKSIFKDIKRSQNQLKIQVRQKFHPNTVFMDKYPVVYQMSGLKMMNLITTLITDMKKASYLNITFWDL